MPVALKTSSTQLTAVIEGDGDQFTARCPELDLAIAGDTQDEALDELVDVAMEYAAEYMERPESFAMNPNRAGHGAYVQVIAMAQSRDAVRRLFTS